MAFLNFSSMREERKSVHITLTDCFISIYYNKLVSRAKRKNRGFYNKLREHERLYHGIIVLKYHSRTRNSY
jgi:hypothetical protein